MVILMNENNLNKIENFIFGNGELNGELFELVENFYNLNNKEEQGFVFQEILETILNRDPDYASDYNSAIEDQLFERFTR